MNDIIINYFDHLQIVVYDKKVLPWPPSIVKYTIYIFTYAL